MSSNKKKRLSLYDFFGKATDTSISSKNTKKHERSASDTTKQSHKLTFQLPDESIVSKLDTKSITKPPASDIKKKYAGLQNTTPNNTNKPLNTKALDNNQSVSSSNSDKTNFTSKTHPPPPPTKVAPVQPSASISQTVPESPVTPVSIPNQNKVNNPYRHSVTGVNYSPNFQSPRVSRSVSSISVSSSVYPNNDNNSILNSVSENNTTPPDFSRTTSSIYPPSTINDFHLKSSGTIKRQDLLKKRKKPPPMPLTVNTKIDNKNGNYNTNENHIVSPSDTLKDTATTMVSIRDPPRRVESENDYGNISSSGSEYSPLRLLKPVNLLPSIKQSPLSSDTHIETFKNIEYEPSTFPKAKFSEEEDNTHKHTKTLSSIEEITSAINSFQLEQEKSLSELEGSGNEEENEGITGGTTNSTVEASSYPVNINLSQDLENHNIDIPFDAHDENNNTNDNTLKTKTPNTMPSTNRTNSGIYVKVGDLPKLEHGENLDEYIEKLKSNIPGSKDSDLVTTNSTSNSSNLLELVQPKSMNGSKSTTSSTSDMFYDAKEDSRESFVNHKFNNSISDMPIDKQNVLQDENCKYDNTEPESINLHNEKNLGDKISEHSKISAIPQIEMNKHYEAPVEVMAPAEVINQLENEILTDYSDDDILGSLDDSNDSFESFVHQLRPDDNRNESFNANSNEKLTELQPISTEASTIPNKVIADDGVWQRYSSGTRLFSNADQLKDIKIVDDNISTNDFESISEPVVLTPTDNKHMDNSQDITPTVPTVSPPPIPVGISSQRDFDLGDELDNNVIAVIEPEELSDNSLEDFYPTHSGDEYNEGSESDDEYEAYEEDEELGGGDFNYDDDDDDDDDDDNDNDDEGSGDAYSDSYRTSESGSNSGMAVNKGLNIVGGDQINRLTPEEDDNDGFLEFSPRSPVTFDSIENMAHTPDIFRHNSMCSRGLLERISGGTSSGTPTGLSIGGRQNLVITNQELNPLEENNSNQNVSESEENEENGVRIPDLESNVSSTYEERVSDSIVNGIKEEITNNDINNSNHELQPHQNFYDRREEPTVMPIQHSMVVTPAAPIPGSISTSKKRRPPPDYASTGRRSRGLSETTANPEMFVNGLQQQLKVSNTRSDRATTSSPTLPNEFTSQLSYDHNTTNNTNNSRDGNNDNNDNNDKNNNNNNDNINNKDNNDTEIKSNEKPGIDDIEKRKGEKCTYIESIRLRGKKTSVSMNPSPQVLPIAIRQNGTISHKKIPSQQLVHSFKSHKHVTVRPKTRLLANEIDDGELPDATTIHRGQKTKVPIHPDAAVIAASEQFNKLAKRQSSDLGRHNSVMSVKPHYGNGMRLFITNPDGDDD